MRMETDLFVYFPQASSVTLTLGVENKEKQVLERASLRSLFPFVSASFDPDDGTPRFYFCRQPSDAVSLHRNRRTGLPVGARNELDTALCGTHPTFTYLPVIPAQGRASRFTAAALDVHQLASCKHGQLLPGLCPRPNERLTPRDSRSVYHHLARSYDWVGPASGQYNTPALSRAHCRQYR